MRGDDGLGHAVIEVLQDSNLRDVDLLKLVGESTRLLEAWRHRQEVIIVDAVILGAAAGSIHRILVDDPRLPTPAIKSSSHGIGLAEAIELGRTLAVLPKHLVVFGVEPGDLTLGTGLTNAVNTALRPLVSDIIVEAKSLCPTRESPDYSIGK